jgi:hypothetical protein
MAVATHVPVTIDIDFTGENVLIGVLFEILGNIGGDLG